MPTGDQLIWESIIRDKIAEIERLRLFLGEIAAMGPADEEWDADTLEGAVAVAKLALMSSK